MNIVKKVGSVTLTVLTSGVIFELAAIGARAMTEDARYVNACGKVAHMVKKGVKR